MPDNKVVYGLKNCHYGSITEVDGNIVFGTPKRMPGGVELSLEPQGEMYKKYADNIVYFARGTNAGYNGTLKMTDIIQDFKINHLGEKLDTKGNLVETADAKTSPFYFLFEFDGDVKARRFCLFNCVAERPKVEGKTSEESLETSDSELTFAATSIGPMNAVKSHTTPDSTNYDTWYTSAPELPEFGGTLKQLTVASEEGTEIGDTSITVTPALASGNSYVYKVLVNPASVEYGQDVSSWTAWDGISDITAETGKVITVVEADADTKAVGAGHATVVSKED